jgi:Zn-dependent peptidase ImmA (M78 family)
VLVDEHLDPEVHPDLEGRFRFTLAHEVGHWQLHRHVHLRPQVSAQPAFLCRTSQSRARVEWQADYFAAALLLPRQLVFAAWQAKGGPAPVLLDDLFPRREALLESEIVRCGAVPQSPEDELNFLLNAVAAPLAETFCVSATAMRIRLEHLGLLLRAVAT